jgi:hypothetical protein
MTKTAYMNQITNKKKESVIAMRIRNKYIICLTFCLQGTSQIESTNQEHLKPREKVKYIWLQ